MTKQNFKSSLLKFQSNNSKYSETIELLSKRYSPENFGKFTSSLFGRQFDSNDIEPVTIDKEFKGVKSVNIVSKYESMHEGEEFEYIIALAVELDKSTYISNQRAYQRGIVSYILANSQEYKKAIVAFYTEGKQAWRLSYIKVDPEEQENIIVPIYRWSFLVGENEPCRTIKDKAQALVGEFDSFDGGEPPTIRQIEQVFTEVNAVTNTFYEQFMNHYSIIKNAIKGNKHQVERLTKNVMGQTIALFFLQKCGFLGVKEGQDWGSGDQYYVTKKIQSYKGNNIYQDVFAPLMSALAGDRPIEGERIPVLNGGLFTVTDHLEDGSPFEIPTLQFKNFINMLSEFNFTVSESDSYDKDIAVDPEMLGKIYESFISTEDEDGRNTKKNTGAVYTPSDIVAAMCKESIAYWLLKQVPNLEKEDIDELLDIPELNLELLYSLKLESKLQDKGFVKSLKSIDQALEHMTILEPSVGSGAFLVGVLLEVAKLRYNIGVILHFLREINNEEFNKYTMYNLKLNTVLSSLHGVDINAGAVDIAKLRIWLSLIVDMQNPKQLPNLDFKIVVGNSVIDRSGSRLLVPKLESINLTKLEELKQEYLTKEHGSKFELRDGVTQELVNVLSSIGDNGSSLSFSITSADGSYKRLQEIKTQEELDQLFARVFSYNVVFSEVMKQGGFDIIIGNPPYVRGNRLGDIKEELQDKFETYHGSADLLVYFYEQGYKLLKENGVLSYITSNKWLTAKYGERLREFILKNTELLLVVDFKGNRVFKGVGVDTEITVFRKSIPRDNTQLVYCSGEEYQVKD